jgi:glycosyltransferase involved in cell wall biosynthesis
MSATPDVSVVCAVGPAPGDLRAVHRRFRQELAGCGQRAEFIYVVDARATDAVPLLSGLHEELFPVRVFRMARGFGESAALQHGFAQASGRFVVTIPDRLQIEPATLPALLGRLEAGAEVVVTRREPRQDAWLNRLQNRLFHTLVRRLVRQEFHDLSCGLRGFTLEAARRLDLYGDQHRFIPVLARQAGFEVEELPGAQLPEDRSLRLRRPGAYARRLLDVLNIYFLVRFTRKPLRFFGLIGLSFFSVGFLLSAYLALQRLLGHSALAGRPLLLLGVLLMLLGVQLTSIGLLGEIIIFLSSRRAAPEVREIPAAQVDPVLRQDRLA